MIKKILAKRFALIVIAVVIVAAFFGYNALFKKSESGYLTEKVSKGTVVKSVSDTGTIRSNSKIDLSFKGIGTIAEIYVKNGDMVKSGQDIAKLDISDLKSQLNQAYADLAVSRAKEHDDLSDAYADGLNTLNDAYTKVYTADNVVFQIQQQYFRDYLGNSGEIINNEKAIAAAKDEIKSYLDAISLVSGNERDKMIEAAVSKAKANVSDSLIAVNNILDIVRSAGFRDQVSETDKALLETQRANLNTLYSSLSSAEQSISAIISSGKNGMSVYQAQIIQSQAKIATLENQIKESVLKSPIDGKVVESDKKEGETVQAKETVASVISTNYFEVKVNIYEGDIADVRVGNPVSIELVAFPDRKISGKVVSVDPSEKVVSDVVYYETTISLDSEPEGVKEGMTADVTIEVFRKDNVLMAPKKSVEKINGDRTVSVLKNGKVEEVKVQAGVEGNDYTEIISGLSEGDEAVIGKKI